ncbi:CRISPR-associated endonuclease Cas1 [soil metagenome]
MTVEGPVPGQVPDLLPARMMNEFVYCPRLFYLEWVDDRWADNDDTAEGSFTHRAVDRAGGLMPPPETAAMLRQVRSLRLEDHDIGLVAVIDRVDGADGTVVPLDLKKGRPDSEGQPWPADRIQSLVQSLLLKRAGYAVTQGLLYYAETNQTVPVELTEAGEREAIDVVSAARLVAQQARPPLPLIDSPKCPRCSLVGLCLPDETNALLQRTELPPRRIVPRDPEHRPAYVTEQGAHVGVSGGRLVVRKDGQKLTDMRLIDVSQLCVFGHVQISSEALARLWTRGVPVLWFSFGGWLRGWAQGEPSRYVELRRRQVIAQSQGGVEIARRFVAGKIRNSRTLLRRNSRSAVDRTLRQLGDLERDSLKATSRAQLMGLEGTAARLYFGEFTQMIATGQTALAAGFDVLGRARRPSPDPLNALLSFCYGLLTKDLVAVCLGVGLDPYLGVLHGSRFGRPSLALDLVEEFRPLIADSTVLGLINNGEIHRSDFISRGAGVALTQDGRRTVIRAYERRLDVQVRHPVFGYKISYRRVLDVQARIFAAVVLAELDDCVPMTTR